MIIDATFGEVNENINATFGEVNAIIEADFEPLVKSASVLTEKTVTENGTYLASEDGADGYSKVVVDHVGSSGLG